jgi:hypothetical protein
LEKIKKTNGIVDSRFSAVGVINVRNIITKQQIVGQYQNEIAEKGLF